MDTDETQIGGKPLMNADWTLTSFPISVHSRFHLVAVFLSVAEKQKAGEEIFSGFFERLAATYSRRTYRTTTIGKAAFDGRVRNGNGSDHSFMATKF